MPIGDLLVTFYTALATFLPVVCCKNAYMYMIKYDDMLSLPF